MEAWAIVVAGGSGTRFGRPKQYAVLGGRRLIDWALEAARAACQGVVVVVPQSDVASMVEFGADGVVGGGATRSASVRAGLTVVPASAEVIVVHDAARPLAGPGLWSAVLSALAAGAEAVVPAVAVSDTIKRVSSDGEVLETLGRSELVAVQTPQGFRADVLRAAHRSGADASDDAALVEAAGGRVVVVPGDPHNLKITDPADLELAEVLLARRDGHGTT
ncbi:MAG TPA: 2-C-methyl-D-erythritol 4-phosphate cytidylyltransferase [Acidimicrobiales bacterium]|nr:2-C-methyl-D-erythritol 4-phosphate cytidylyltransferase [Acidimicrobiales bacterium]